MSEAIKCHAMFPVLATAKLPQQQQFYQQNFAFETVFYEEGFYLHLVQPSSNIQLGFLQPNLNNQPAFLQHAANSQGIAISLEVEDAEHAYEQATAKQLEIALPLKDEEWGQRHFIVVDPAGFYIDIVQHL